MHLTISSGLLVCKTNWIFHDNIFGVEFNFKFKKKRLQTHLFEALSFSKTLLFCSFIISKESTGPVYRHIKFIFRNQPLNGVFVYSKTFEFLEIMTSFP